MSLALQAISQATVVAAEPAHSYKTAMASHVSGSELDAWGLPTKQLESLLRDKKIRQARLILARTPRRKGDEDARTMWDAACLSVECKYDESVETFGKVRHLENGGGYVLYLAAMAYAQMQQFSRARELSTVAIERYKNTACYELRATCYNDEKRYVEAAADYEKAALYSRSHASDFYCEAAQALLKANQAERALLLVDKASALQNASLIGSLRLTKGRCLEKLGRWSEAVSELSKAIECSKSRSKEEVSTSRFWLVSCLRERADCYDKLGLKAEAAADRTTLANMSSGLVNDLLGK
ncbi:MAG: hypothetical protein JST01_20535 [Cyanobacteria bacterium SZAS TMP-1]|nr:hypothetical protein [Cyanobacteria bacterium SZAS TMP-1]